MIDNKYYLSVYSDVLDDHSDELLPDVVTTATQVLKGMNYIDSDSPEVMDYVVDVLSNYSVSTLIQKEPYELIDLIYNHATDEFYEKAFKFFNAGPVYATEDSYDEIAKLIKKSKLSDIVKALDAMDNDTPNEWTKEMMGNQSYNKLELIIKVESGRCYFLSEKGWVDDCISHSVYTYSDGYVTSHEVTCVCKKDKNTAIIKEITNQLIASGVNVTDMHIKTSDVDISTM